MKMIQVTKEFRQNHAKIAAKIAETSKMEVKNIRHVILKKIKDLEGIGSDEKKMLQKNAEKVLDKTFDEIENRLKLKSKEILEG